MQIIWILLALFLITLFRTWFFRQIFARFNTINISKTQQLLFAGILVGSLAGYEWISSTLGGSSIKTEIWGHTGLIFWLWCIFVITILWAVRSLRKKKKIWLQSAVWSLILGILIRTMSKVSFWSFFWVLWVLVPYYIILAYTEEFFKFSLAQYQNEWENQQTISQLLALSLLVSFAFALIENGLALIMMILGKNEIWWGFILARGIVATMVHLLATGTIALVLLKWRNLRRYLIYPIALGIGFAIHGIYNLGQAFWIGSISFILAVWGFFGLSYLLYHLDELYLNGGEEKLN